MALVNVEWMSTLKTTDSFSRMSREIPSLLLISDKSHKARAVNTAIDGLKLPHTLGHLKVGHIEEAYWVKPTGHFIRRKMSEAVNSFFVVYPAVIAMLDYLKEEELRLLSVDVRRKRGEQGSSLVEMHQPPEKVYTRQTIYKYIHEQYEMCGTKHALERVETALDQAVIGRGREKAVSVCFPNRPVVSGIYVNYERNPIATYEQAKTYTDFSRWETNNTHSLKNFKASGGILLDWLLMFASLSGVDLRVDYHKNLKLRMENVPVKNMLTHMYTPAFIGKLESIVGPVDKGPNQDWGRDMLLASVSVKDHVLGGSWDAVDALLGQIKNGRGDCGDSAVPVDLKASESVNIQPLMDTFDRQLLPKPF